MQESAFICVQTLRFLIKFPRGLEPNVTSHARVNTSCKQVVPYLNKIAVVLTCLTGNLAPSLTAIGATTKVMIPVAVKAMNMFLLVIFCHIKTRLWLMVAAKVMTMTNKTKMGSLRPF